MNGTTPAMDRFSAGADGDESNTKPTFRRQTLDYAKVWLV